MQFKSKIASWSSTRLSHRMFIYQTRKIMTHDSKLHSAAYSISEKLLLLLKQCKFIRQVQQIHTQMLIHSIEKHNFLLSKVIELKDFNYSLLIFTHLRNPNGYAFNIFIRGLTTTWKKFDSALNFFYKMKYLGLKPDNFTYPFVFISCGNLGAYDHGRLAHCGVLKGGLWLDFHVCHSLITMYSRCSQLGFARKVFDEMELRDLVSWNSMISGYSKMGFAREAVVLFDSMTDQQVVPDEMTLVSVLGACGDLGDLELGRSVEYYVTKNKMTLNSYIGSALIDMYGKCRDLCSARRIFDTMGMKDSITWNAMITGYAQNGYSDEAISLYKDMKAAGVKVDRITMVVVLSACASVGALEIGKHIFEYALLHDLKHDIYVCTALIDMFAKCGNLDYSFQVFENMTRKNEVSWNAMISALAFHGRAQEAISLFNRMVRGGGASPNDITFISVLSACVHAGLVDEGCRLFELMSSSFSITPKIEHYSCVVDLLSRAGRVYEAWDFIEKMPVKPDEVLLGSLLGACHKIRNIDVGERVTQLLLEMEPSNSGNYVISSKLYANERRWNDSARVRLLMRQKGVTKTPGCSWIETDSQLLEFHADEYLHYAQELYRVLNSLYEEMSFECHLSDEDIYLVEE
ncbi:OLC1v1001115C1 [Oldenlandia corymbosa var. corymbosa]|uniref:OLC1v1001115C1 n=1 Tax=Oldenlandia corymbosa var. corymbosa TaxID=529605 RepID=A0AAV1D7I9_OLDCO|nr:OLC1v1001115C1 [Oldenlandia corymbosa var. corymbosa]